MRSETQQVEMLCFVFGLCMREWMQGSGSLFLNFLLGEGSREQSRTFSRDSATVARYFAAICRQLSAGGYAVCLAELNASSEQQMCVFWASLNSVLLAVRAAL